MSLVGLPYGVQEVGCDIFERLPTEIATQIFGIVIDYHDIESGKDYLDVISLYTLLDVCTTWASITLSIVKIRPHFRFNGLCDVYVLRHVLEISHPSFISIALNFPKHLPPMPYWNFLVILFQHSQRFVDFQVSTVPSNYRMLSKNMLGCKFSATETLGVVMIEEKDLTTSPRNDNLYRIISKLDIDTSKLRHLQLQGIEWEDPVEGQRDLSHQDTVFIHESFVDWFSISVLIKKLSSFSITGNSRKSFLLQNSITHQPSASSAALNYLHIGQCSPSWVFQNLFFRPSYIKTLVFSNMTLTHWINVLRVIEKASSDLNFSGVKSLEVSFVDNAAAYAAISQSTYSSFYRSFENLTSLVVLNTQHDAYFLGPLKLNPNLCPSLLSVDINGHRVFRNDLGFNT